MKIKRRRLDRRLGERQEGTGAWKYEEKERFRSVEKENFFAADQFSRGTLLRLVVPLKRGITMPAADRGEKFQRDARGDGEDAFVGKNDGSIIFESLGFQFIVFALSPLSLSSSASSLPWISPRVSVCAQRPLIKKGKRRTVGGGEEIKYTSGKTS